LSGVPKYNLASWILQVLVCDYLDMFSSLSLVQPPDDYIRNPACVRRDEHARQMKILSMQNRDIRVRLIISVAVKKQCYKKFRFSLFSSIYTKFLPDWDSGYLDQCLFTWPNDEVLVEMLEEEVNRLIDDALKKNPSLDYLETIGAVSVTDTDDTTGEEKEE
jgi:hypothetical protein